MNNHQIKAGIIGAGGFTGQELIRIFSRHPGVNLTWITSDAYQDLFLNEVMPELSHPDYRDLKFSSHPKTEGDIPDIDVIFLAVPDETSIFWLEKLSLTKIRVIDISGAFRLNDPKEYVKFYGFKHSAPHLLGNVVYGLTEINRDKIKQSRIIANPGCYATAAILPILFLKEFLSSADGRIIIDAKSGTSGAGGRKEKDSLPFSKIYENFKAYKIKAHQHIPEIVQQISPVFPNSVLLNMTPHLLPLFRGIQVNTYIYLNSAPDVSKMVAKMREISSKETFIRYYENPEQIELRNVQGKNFLDFGFYYDTSSGLLQIISAIDNLQKGAAGQAVQNLNLMFGFTEHQGLL